MRFRSFVCLLLVLMLGLLFSGCSRSPAPATEAIDSTQETASDNSSETTEVATSDVASTAPEIDPDREVVALINGYPVYRDEFEGSKSALLSQYQQTYSQFGMDISMLMAGADGRLFELGVEAEALLQMAQLILTQQEADRRGIVITDEEIQQEFNSQYNVFLTGQGWTEELLAVYLAQQGRTIETFKQDALDYVANQILAMNVQKAVAGSLDITEEQVSDYFAEHKIDYEIEEQVRASHILFGTSENDLLAFIDEHVVDYEVDGEIPEIEGIEDQVRTDIRELAVQVLAELAAGADFAELAQEHSTGPTGPNGGDLNWFGRGAMVAPFEEAAFALAVGDISDIVETQYGYHIILLTNRQDASSPELADVIDQVRADLENELTYERALEWYEGVFSSAKFDIRQPLLDAIVKQADDIDAAIDILERAKTDDTSDDPYLPFVLGTFYQRKLDTALAEKTAALGAEGSAETEDEIAALKPQIDEYRTKALAAFRLAQEAVGEDPGIQSAIDAIEAPTDGSEDEAP